ncbi:3,4-dihydroxy-2-butanone-4-phosphate synthase [bacterium]|nr:3,4-dihydroxy-2-butanone-4-phosphate synthase [bacterium]
MNPFSSIPEAVKEFKRGNALIVLDSPTRENQADLIFAGEKITSKKINFFLKNCRGLICAAISKKIANKLKIPLMVSPAENKEKTGVQFMVSVDAKNVNSFGISSSDRAKTIKILASPNSSPDDLVRPGHVFPLLAREGGVLERQGHTEATVDLAKLSGLSAVGVLSEILDENGEPARLPKLIKLSIRFKIKIITIEDLFRYLKKHPLRS